MTEYNPWYQPGEQLMQCLSCGAAVCDTELHSQWHAKPEQIPVIQMPPSDSDPNEWNTLGQDFGIILRGD